MLSKEVMGGLCLAILWVNALLIAGAALKELQTLRRKLATIQGGGLVRGRVVRGNGPQGELAAHVVEQLGRAAENGSIRFGDRAFKSVVHGGSIAVEGAEGELVLEETSSGDVWVRPDQMTESVACEGEHAFDEAFASARKARGFARDIVVRIAPGADVWALTLAGGEVFVSTLDPTAWLGRKCLLAMGFVVGELLACGVCTALALTHPSFGAVSTVGGALGLAFFLLAQPAGTALRDAVRFPSRAFLRGAWVKPARENGEARATSS